MRKRLFIIRFTKKESTVVETMSVSANTQEEAINNLNKMFRMIACYPAEWETI